MITDSPGAVVPLEGRGVDVPAVEVVLRAQTVEQIDRRELAPPLWNWTRMSRPMPADGTSRYSTGSPGGERSGRCGAADDTDQAREQGSDSAATATRRNQAPRNFSTKLMQLFPFLFVCFAPQAIRAAVPG